MVNKPSQNLYADMLIKTLAAEFPRQSEDEEPGSTELGLEVAMQTFVKAGIDTSGIQLADGSGLSRHNLVTPGMTVSLLRYMWNYPDDRVRAAFYNSLPVAGVEGTLRNRMRSGPARENLRAKTGSLSNVSSLSGYIQAADGTPLAFAAMCNHFTTRTRDVRRAQDLLADVLAGFRK
jgi:D-alanyl-D-alanine carboxypeptidase/D-alanyl-D-alanine-endopeptidase (penicillin-binding protein 4)